MPGQSAVEVLKSKFDQYSSWEEKYKFMIEMGKSLAPMPDDLKTDENKVRGCQSQVWLSAHLDGNKVEFLADSDASIVKGIVSILIQIYSGLHPDEILAFKPNFIDELGLKQHLSLSRANGLASMLKQISLYALAFSTKLKMENL